jgi:hypothetical protein
MATATKNVRQGTKKNPVTPTRDEVLAAVRELGGAAEVKRYESVEALEKTHGQHDVLHRWNVGHILEVSWKEHEDAAINIYSTGLQRSAQMLRLSVRLAEMYKLTQLRKMLTEAGTAGHELNFNHFRQFMREGLTDAHRDDLVRRTVEGRWGYRELKDVITAQLGGKKSKGGRKLGKVEYKTYNRALSAMKMRSQAWLALEAGWLPQVDILVAKLKDDEKLTPEFLALTQSAASQLREVATKATLDAEAAEAIAKAVSEAMGEPELKLEDEDVESPAKTNGVHKVAAKANGKAKPSKRIRLAKHPRVTNGKLVSAN